MEIAILVLIVVGVLVVDVLFFSKRG